MVGFTHKMLNKCFKKIIVLLLITSFVATPFGVLKSAYAQQSGGFQSNGSYGNGPGVNAGGGLSGYVKGLAPAITQLPLCKDKIDGAIKNVFGKIKGIFKNKKSKKANSKNVIDESQALEDAIHTESVTANKQNAEILEVSKETKEKVSSLEQNDTCLKSIGRMVIKLLIQKFTLSTVAWIQSGYEGSPLFLQDPKRFFGDIAKNEILQFGAELNDATLFPFGKAFMQRQALAYNKKFQDNARYSLNELIQSTTPQYSSLSFRANFSLGGWDAWNFMTQVPANNYLGFNMLASKELSKRLEGTDTAIGIRMKESLAQAGGFLGDYRCADPEGLSKAAHDAALVAGIPEKIVKGTKMTPDPAGGPPKIETIWETTGYVMGACKKWEYKTPGAMIAESATNLVHYQDNNLLNVDDLNGAVAAILDAVIAQFSAKYMENGFADFSDEGLDGSFVMNFDEMEGNNDPSQTEKDYNSNHLSSSNWLEEHPGFNLRTDLTQAIIDEQRVYISKLEEQNDVMVEGMPNTGRTLLKTIRQLDYCIPGPNPKYESESGVEEFYRTVKVSPKKQMPLAAQMALSFDPTGIISGVANAIFGNKEERHVKERIAKQMQEIYGVHIYGGQVKIDDGEQDQVINEAGMRDVMENTFQTYRNGIYKIYFAGSKSLAPMPLVTEEARRLYNALPGYENLYETNDEDIIYMKSIVNRLAQIKEAMDTLNPGHDPVLDPAGEAAMKKDWLPYFARISQEMVTGNDVAKADDLLQELKEREKYAFESLLQGPGGCEKEMENLFSTDQDKYSKFIRRQPYPLPIYYFYQNPPGSESNDPGDPDPQGPPPPNPNTIKYFGSNPDIQGKSGAWVGNGPSGTWWTGTPGTGFNIFYSSPNPIGGSGSWTGTGNGGTFTATGTGLPDGQATGTWIGPNGNGDWIGIFANGACVPPTPANPQPCTWGGGNGQGINGGGFAPTSGTWVGSAAGVQNINGNWSGPEGTGSWMGVLANNGGAVGTWSGGNGLNNTGLWQPGDPPPGGGGPNNPGPGGPGCVGNNPPPCHIPWSEDLVSTWDKNQGFMYGMIYVNDWAWSAIENSILKNQMAKDESGNPTGKIEYLCPKQFLWELFPEYVEISLPGGGEPDGPIPDIGGLEPWGNNGSWGFSADTANTCGVITRQLEKILGIF